MNKCLLTLLTSLLTIHSAWTRPSEELTQAYKHAKAHYIAAEYEQAKEALVPLIDLEDKTEITPYALFYFALATYHNHEPALAESTFSTVMEEFPDWEQLEEARYWLAQLRFEHKDYKTGLEHIASIRDRSLQKAAHTLKQYFLATIQETATLYSLLQCYPKDRSIAQILFDKLAQQPLIRQDTGLLDLLSQEYGFKQTKRDPLKRLSSIQKPRYNVAVFLPFFLDEVDYEEEKSSNQFVVSLYKGLKVAVAQLAEQGIEINLLAYDTKKDPITTAALLKDPTLKDVDLIIGPLYAATLPLVTSFAQAHRINIFNPLSENADVVGHNPFAFLFQPSEETQASKAARLTVQEASGPINVGIVYGTTKADIRKAHAYKQYLEQLTGQEVGLMLSVDSQGAQNFLDGVRKILDPPPKQQAAETASEPEEEEEEEKLCLEGLTHLYIASRDELIVANFLSAVEMSKLDICIVGDGAWLHQSTTTFDQLRRCKLRMIAPQYIDYSQPAIYNFRKAFYEYYAHYPDYYACTGYELMLFLGTMLSKYGIYFQKHWGSDRCPGTLFGGSSYGPHHDNQHMPVIKFRKNRLVVCNADKPEVELGQG